MYIYIYTYIGIHIYVYLYIYIYIYRYICPNSDARHDCLVVRYAVGGSVKQIACDGLLGFCVGLRGLSNLRTIPLMWRNHWTTKTNTNKQWYLLAATRDSPAPSAIWRDSKTTSSKTILTAHVARKWRMSGPQLLHAALGTGKIEVSSDFLFWISLHVLCYLLTF